MNAQQRRGERYRAWLKVQEGRADDCVAPKAVRLLAAEYEIEALRAVSSVMARDLALLFTAGHGEVGGAEGVPREQRNTPKACIS